MTPPALHLALDYTAAASHWPGVGRYGRELVRALVRRADCPELLLFECGRATPLPTAALGLEAAPTGRVRRVRVRGRARLLELRASLFGRGIEGALSAPDLVHRAFPGRPPVRGLPQVQPLFELPDALGLATLAGHLSQYERVLVGSRRGLEVAAAALAPHGLARARLAAVRTGADHWLRDAEPKSAAQLTSAGPPQLLALGALGRARHPRRLLAAFELLCARRAPGERPRLYFDGRPGDDSSAFRAALAASPFAERVTWNPDPREADLPALVAASAVLVHLSEGELSPITPLEALHFGTAVVASRLPAFEELLGPAALVDASADAAALALALDQALASAFDERAREARRTTAAPFTWEVCAADHVALWQALVSPQG